MLSTPQLVVPIVPENHHTSMQQKPMEVQVEQRSQAPVEGSNTAQPVPGTHAYEALPQFPQRPPFPSAAPSDAMNCTRWSRWPKRLSTKWSAAESSRAAST